MNKNKEYFNDIVAEISYERFKQIEKYLDNPNFKEFIEELITKIVVLELKVNDLETLIKDIL